MKRGLAVFFVLLLAGAAGAGTYYQFIYQREEGTDSSRVSSDSEDAIYVDSVSMLAGLGSGTGIIMRYAGAVEPQRTWDAKVENDRKIAQTYVREGDTVRQGDKLFTYDISEYEDKLEQEQIDIERLQNEITSANASMANLQKQQAKASGDEALTLTNELLTLQNQIKQCEFDIRSKQLNISNYEQTIDNADVVSELDGVIKSVKDPSSDSGSYVYGMSSDNSNVYITVMEVGSYRVKGSVNEQNISSIYEGQRMLIYSRVDSSVYWRGAISEIDTDKGDTGNSDNYYGYGMGMDTGTSSTKYPFYVELDSSDGLLLGQHVYMEPDQGQASGREGIWLDDYYFVTEDDGSAWIWAASSSNRLEKRAVVLGEYEENLGVWQVLEGLDAEDYVTTPSDGLAEGMPVNYVDYSEATFDNPFGQDDQGDDFGNYWDEGMSYGDEEVFFEDDGSGEVNGDIQFVDEDGGNMNEDILFVDDEDANLNDDEIPFFDADALDFG